MLNVEVAVVPEQVNAWDIVESGSQSTVELVDSVSTTIFVQSALVNESVTLQVIADPCGTDWVAAELLVELPEIEKFEFFVCHPSLSIWYSIFT